MTDPRPKPARPSPWLFAVVYGVHLLDEGLVAGGLPQWATSHGFYFTTLHWLSVSLISFCLFSGAVWLVARETWPSWVLVALSVHITLHALMHVAASIWARSLSPGILTGLVLALPLAVWAYRWAREVLDQRVLVRAAFVGAATLQAPWDMLVRLTLGLQIWTT